MDDALVMFDLDGTLIGTSQLYLQGYQRVIERHCGVFVSTDDIVPMWGWFARDVFVHFARMVGRQDEELVHLMYAEFSHFYNEMHNQLSKTYDGVSELLPTIRESVHAVGVVTGRTTDRSTPVFALSWARHMDFFVWGDQVSRKKPFPDLIELAIEHYALDGGLCMYVGDNGLDMEAAHACRQKVLSVAALWGALDGTGLLAAKPDVSFETFREFADWIRRRSRKG
jgi:HAD superfamily hydrolase (TIGR01549 family)